MLVGTLFKRTKYWSFCGLIALLLFFHAQAKSERVSSLPPRFESFAEQFAMHTKEADTFYETIAGEADDIHLQWLNGALSYKTDLQADWENADSARRAKYAPLMQSLGVRFGGLQEGRVYFGGFSFPEKGKFFIVDIRKYAEGLSTALCREGWAEADTGECDEPLNDGWFAHYVWTSL